MKNKLYVLVDKTLNPIYGAVQGGHAVAEWVLDHGQSQKWLNEYLIYLSVDIDKWKDRIKYYGCNYYSEFHEPDLDNKLTSIAIHESGINDILKKYLKKERLLK